MTIRIAVDCNGRKYITDEPKLHESTWVGLHPTTILDIYTETLKTHRGGSMPDGQIAFARAIEQALKERNT